MYGSHFPTARYPLLRFTTWCTMHHVKSCLIGILTGVNTTCIRVQHDAYKTIYKRQNRCFIAMLAICSSSAARKNLNFCHKSWNSYTDRLVSGKKRLSVSGKKKKKQKYCLIGLVYMLWVLCVLSKCIRTIAKLEFMLMPLFFMLRDQLAFPIQWKRIWLNIKDWTLISCQWNITSSGSGLTLDFRLEWPIYSMEP